MTGPIAGALSGWSSLAAFTAAIFAAIALRRFKRTPPLVRRMRPHYVLGYSALAFAVAHAGLSMGAMSQTTSMSLWLATVALFILGIQTFVGASLQDPGGYRRLLRGWHIALLVAIAGTAAAHIMANGGSLL